MPLQFWSRTPAGVVDSGRSASAEAARVDSHHPLQPVRVVTPAKVEMGQGKVLDQDHSAPWNFQPWEKYEKLQ